MEVRKLYEQSTMAFSEFLYIFITWGIFLPYWTGWLVDAKHLTVSQASVVMGCGLLARATSNLFFFPTLAKYVHNKRLITILAIGSLLTALLYIPSTGFTALLIVTILFSVFTQRYYLLWKAVPLRLCSMAIFIMVKAVPMVHLALSSLF